MRATLAVLRGALADAVARRASFAGQVAVMVVNDVALLAFWLIFFARVPSVRGWDVDAVLVLFAVLAVSGGLVLGVLSNSRRIPHLVTSGALDDTLTLPVDPLAHLLVRTTTAVNFGDVVFGVVLFAVRGHPTPQRVALFVFGVLAATAVMAAFFVASGSLVFFTDREEPGSLGMHAMLLLSFYPADVFDGALRILLYTAVPAAFVGAVPARVVEHPTWGQAGLLLAVAVVSVVLARRVFTLGLRRYTSGSAWARG